jgi:hypothetical protein
MKSFIFILLTLVFLQNKFCFSQSMSGIATMDAGWVVHLNGSTVFTEYNTDVSAVGFISQEQGEKFSLWFSDNLVEFRDFNFVSKRVKVIIHPEYLRNAWTVTQWNDYLQNKANQRKSEFPVIPY